MFFTVLVHQVEESGKLWKVGPRQSTRPFYPLHIVCFLESLANMPSLQYYSRIAAGPFNSYLPTFKVNGTWCVTCVKCNTHSMHKIGLHPVTLVKLEALPHYAKYLRNGITNSSSLPMGFSPAYSDRSVW